MDCLILPDTLRSVHGQEGYRLLFTTDPGKEL